MDEENKTNQSEDIKKLLEQNLKLTEEIFVMTKKIKSYITFQKFMSFIYILLIIGPIILGLIYLPPLLSGMFDQYKNILGLQGESSNAIESLLNGSAGKIDINDLSPQLQRLLNK